LEKADVSFSFPNDFRKVIGEVNDAGMLRDDDASIDNKV
jgi:hypothetical protein